MVASTAGVFATVAVVAILAMAWHASPLPIDYGTPADKACKSMHEPGPLTAENHDRYYGLLEASKPH